MTTCFDKGQAIGLLREYNKERFHVQHGLTVGACMRWFAETLGYGGDAAYWEAVGILHDIDFELYPDEHCQKAPEMLRNAGATDDFIRSVCSHGYGLASDIKPEHEMEKVLFAIDELTGLIGAAALMRPSKSVADMETKSLKKKFKDRKFAAGCSREIIEQGCSMLDWEMDDLFSKCLEAMRFCEAAVEAELALM